MKRFVHRGTFILIRKILLLFILLGLLFWFGFIIKKRAFQYDYNTRTDYLYCFDSAYAKIDTVVIRNNILELTKYDSDYNTALLEIRVKSGILGYLNLPEVELEHDSLHATQNFECGAKGIRYLNLSGFVKNKTDRIAIKLHRLSILTDTCRLILYRNKEIGNESLLVLSSHPDDAEIAAFGLYSSNKNSFIVTITAGDAGKSKYEDFYDSDHDHYLKKAELRVWNSITVPLLAEISPQNIINLGYFDSKLKSMYSNDTLIETSKFIGISDINVFRSKNISSVLDSLKGLSNWHSLVNDLKFILKKRKPTVIVTPYPAIDTHFDHKFTTIALFQAMRELNYFDTELWMYTNHYSKPDFYPIGKIGSLTSVPPYFKKPPVYFNKIYSHPLSTKMQIDKLFALDAMNDLRHNTEWNTIGDLCQVLNRKVTDKLYLQETNYYRRSVRNNELFFVIEGYKLKNDSIYKMVIGDLDN